MNRYAAYTAPMMTQDPREVEALALRSASRRLREARDRLERNRALNINHEMWSILFRELNSSACLLPEILKQDCIKLAVWSLSYSNRAVLSDMSVLPLTEVNDAVAEGLEARHHPSSSGPVDAMLATCSTSA